MILSSANSHCFEWMMYTSSDIQCPNLHVSLDINKNNSNPVYHINQHRWTLFACVFCSYLCHGTHRISMQWSSLRWYFQRRMLHDQRPTFQRIRVESSSVKKMCISLKLQNLSKFAHRFTPLFVSRMISSKRFSHGCATRWMLTRPSFSVVSLEDVIHHFGHTGCIHGFSFGHLYQWHPCFGFAYTCVHEILGHCNRAA